MEQTTIYKTKNENIYIYDDQYQLSNLVHPDLKGAIENSLDKNNYYIKKYNYLKKNGFFKKVTPVEFTGITELMIKDGIKRVSKIVFEVTDSCNLNCTYCGYGEIYEVFNERNNHNINIDSAKKLLDYLFYLKKDEINSSLMIGFYGGEPLINISFIHAIVDYVNLLNLNDKINIEYSITTNATLIHKYTDFLIKNNFYILISLDGDEKGNDYRIYKNKNNRSFQKVIHNVDVIYQNYPEYFSKYISFNAVLHNHNSVKSIYEFIHNRYRKIPSISELLSSNVRFEKKAVFKEMYHSLKKSESEYYKSESVVIDETRRDSIIYNELSDFLKQVHFTSYIWQVNDLFNKQKKYIPTNTCIPFSLKIFLTSHNLILPCERVSHKYYLGEVKDEIEIDAKAIANTYNSYYKKIENVCQYCYSYRYCGKCVYQIENINTHGNKNIICDKFCNQKDFANKLERIFSYMETFPHDYSFILKEV